MLKYDVKIITKSTVTFWNKNARAIEGISAKYHNAICLYNTKIVYGINN